MTDENETPPAAERISVSLTPKVSRELADLRASTTMSRTDLVNRAVSLYAFVDRQLTDGAELAIHFPASGETRIVHLS